MNSIIAQAGIEELSETYLHQYFIAGGPKVWFILLPMSIAALYLIIDISISIRRKRLLPASIGSEIATFAPQFGLSAIPGRFSKNTDLISRTLCAVYGRSPKKSLRLRHSKEIAAESLQEQGMKLLRRTEICNLLGNVSPMVGLFGTVYGMIDAFNQIGVSQGQPKPGELAHGISIALVATYWGLMIAIPSLFFSGVFKVKIEGIIADAAVEVEVLLERLSELKPIVVSNTVLPDEKAQIRQIKTIGGNGDEQSKEKPQTDAAVIIPKLKSSMEHPKLPKQPLIQV